MRLSEELSIINQFTKRAPVDVELLSRALGIPVHEAYLPEDISGMIERTSSGFKITVNAGHSKTRKRFTIAHELGHYVYHRHLIGAGVDDDRAYRSTTKGRYRNMAIGPVQETEANRFAAGILMPHGLIEEARRDGLNSPRAMADRLGVSEHAMCIRLGEPYEPRFQLRV